MVYSNPFDLLTDHDNDDLSLLIANRRKTDTRSTMKSPNEAKKPFSPTQPTVNAPSKLSCKAVPQPKPVKEAKVSRGFDDAENNCVLESGFRRKFGVSEDGEIEKPSGGGGGGGGRSYSSGGLRGSYRSGNRRYCRPGRAFTNSRADDLVSVSSKYRLFDRHGLYGRGNAVKREGFGSWNWGMMGDVGLEERSVGLTNCSGRYAIIEERALEIFKDDVNVNQTEEDESEDKEMTLDEYERVVEQKKKALQEVLLEISAKRDNDYEFIKQDLGRELDQRTYYQEELADGFVIIDAVEEEDF